MSPIIRIVALLAGIALVLVAVRSAVRMFILPRAAPDPIVRVTFRLVRRIVGLFARPSLPFEQRDRALAFLSPIGLFVMPFVWLVIIMLGYAFVFIALGVTPAWEALRDSLSALLTLGFATPPEEVPTLVVFTEAIMGPLMIGLLISYLPTIYSAFSRRETLVTLLEVRAGSPPSAIELILRYFRIRGLDAMAELWPQWEVWFSELDESHTSLFVLTFFRSPQPDRSWITAAGAVLDAAALRASTLDLPREPHAELCIRAGFLALRHICDFFGIAYEPNVKKGDPISIRREEFDAACQRLEDGGLPLKADRDQAWADFAGWRVNYDRPLISLCTLVTAPPAPWSSDRGPELRLPKIFRP